MRNNRLQDLDQNLDNQNMKGASNNNNDPNSSNNTGLGALIKLEVLDISKNKIKSLDALSNYAITELHI